MELFWAVIEVCLICCGCLLVFAEYDHCSNCFGLCLGCHMLWVIGCCGYVWARLELFWVVSGLVVCNGVLLLGIALGCGVVLCGLLWLFGWCCCAFRSIRLQGVVHCLCLCLMCCGIAEGCVCPVSFICCGCLVAVSVCSLLELL